MFFFAFFLISGTLPFHSCTRTITEHDTTTVTVRDTTVLTVRDTLTKVDSIYDLKDGLVAYYNFTGGNLSDSSGFSNNIVFSNATMTADRFGNANNAYLFDGSSSYMRVVTSESLNPDAITLFAIMKVNGFSQSLCHANQVLGKGWPDYINGFYCLRFDDFSTTCVSAPNAGSEFFAGFYGDNNPQGTAAIAGKSIVTVSTSKWYYLAFTYDGINAKMYVNGQLTDSVRKAVAFTDNTHDLFIGKHEDPSYPYFFNGVIDEVRIYNRALPPAAILQLNNVKE